MSKMWCCRRSTSSCLMAFDVFCVAQLIFSSHPTSSRLVPKNPDLSRLSSLIYLTPLHHAMPVYAPPLPTVPAASALVDASTQKYASPLDASTRKQTGPDDASTRKHATDPSQPTAGQGNASPSRTTKARTPTAVPDGAKIDTGVIPGSNSRYMRVVAAVQAKKHAPTLAAIQREHGGGPTVAMRYQREMLRTGVIVPREKGKGCRVA